MPGPWRISSLLWLFSREGKQDPQCWDLQQAHLISLESSHIVSPSQNMEEVRKKSKEKRSLFVVLDTPSGPKDRYFLSGRETFLPNLLKSYRYCFQDKEDSSKPSDIRFLLVRHIKGISRVKWSNTTTACGEDLKRDIQFTPTHHSW